MKRRSIPEATVGRLPLYLRSLIDLMNDRGATVSSDELAQLTGVTAAQVRKDLSYVGNFGTRGVGYDVQYLVSQISRELGLTQEWPVAIIGFGNLGHALYNYKGFEERGFNVVAVFDSDRSKIGTKVGPLKVRDIEQIAQVAKADHIEIAIIATPANAAQAVADKAVAAGIGSILNFAPTWLSVPSGVSVRKVDLSVELQILTFYEQRDQARLKKGLAG